MAAIGPLSRDERRRRILAARSLQELVAEPGGWEILEAESADPEGLIRPEEVQQLRVLLAERDASRRRLGAFFSTDDVIIVPGFMGSRLTDVDGGNGLIWIDPTLVVNGGQLAALKLKPAFDQHQVEQDFTPGVRVEAPGALPAIYDLMRLSLEVRRYDTSIFGFDWRKNLEESAARLAASIQARVGRTTHPLHLIAHSQGSLVARRALQLLGPKLARQLVSHLVLLGPASYGTFSAAFAIAGSHETIQTVSDWGVKLPNQFEQVLQSFTGLYQLIPWKKKDATSSTDTDRFKKSDFWETGVDQKRLDFGFRWADTIDTAFFNDRTTIILGDAQTVTDVQWVGGKLVEAAHTAKGDGTVPDVWARLEGVRTYRAAKTTHTGLSMSGTVRSAILSILTDRTPNLARVLSIDSSDVPTLQPVETPKPSQPTKTRLVSAAAPEQGLARAEMEPVSSRPVHAPPPTRRLRVYSFDPLLAQSLDTLKISVLTIDVPWEDAMSLSEGPIGEYVAVIDYDPAGDCFYHPINLSSPELLAQDGLAPAESNPQFHQQMVYAISMATIDVFEKALGRVALWSPRLIRNTEGSVIGSEYVPRLRIYPHAIPQANAYYDPDRHALLFGYFRSRGKVGGMTLPGGVIHTCLSYDIIAHETSHALLHGLHRYLLEASNPDMLAFHEAFSDIVALLQHFSHMDVLRDQIAKSRGDLQSQGLLGQMAVQFGEAMGEHRGGLRKYLAEQLDDGTFVPKKPDPSAYSEVTEPHDRGAILVAAVFGAFLKIYRDRTRDLYRLVSNGTGVLPEGEIHPDLVNRLAREATRSASHVLRMCIRALDYIPPVDLTFGEYLRALITADYDLVPDDDRGYRVAVVDAFREWGIYPSDLQTLDVNALLWEQPEGFDCEGLQQVLEGIPHTDWKLRVDRRQVFENTEENQFSFRAWLYDNAKQMRDGGDSLGIKVFTRDDHSLPRNKSNRLKFEVHSVRPCSRIGPDGQQRIDLVAVVVQKRAGYFDPEVQKEVDAGPPPAKGKKKGQPDKTYWAFTPADAKKFKRPLAPTPDFWFRGGATLIIDPESGEIRYLIRKRIMNDQRLSRQRDYEQTGRFVPAAATYFDPDQRSPFALLHDAEVETE
ncbi:hypothetical protein GC163_01200 [bacterium]|nr:hypothetical protein [bacterium]